MRLGLISDTHGLLRPQAVSALTGSDLIIHAGDVGKVEILQELRAIAPLVAIRGNVDTGEWALALAEITVVEAGDTGIYVVHDVRTLDVKAAAGCQIVISGHSHQPGAVERGGVLYINPGSAGPRRFKLPITVARLDLSRRPWAVEFIDLTRQPG